VIAAARVPRRWAVLLVLLAAATLGGGPTTAAEPELETRVFVVEFKPLEDVILLVRDVLGENGSLTMQPRLRAVTITDESARLDRIGRLLETFDVPPRQVELAVQLLMGSREDGPEGAARRPRVPSLPGIDRALIKTLITTTQWTDYRLLGSAAFTAAEGEESTLSLGEEYRIRLKVGAVNPEHRVTRFERFALERRHTAADGREELRPIWDQVLNLRDRQLYLFGATSMEESRRAIFLSITAGIVR
jgi:hypothetical protein